jgi:hypothetical protein
MRKNLFLALVLGMAFAGCGGDSSPSGPNPGPTPTPAPTPAPTPTPTPDPNDPALCVNPKPAPVARIEVKIQLDVGFRKVLTSTPLVGPDRDYCATIGYTDGRRFCPTRPEGHPLQPACDALVMGRATDTGRIGPTWNRNGQPCQPPQPTAPPGEGQSKCVNNGDNQFNLWAYGTGNFEACSNVTVNICGSIDLP